jgi:Flp pilus assembly protein TadD
LLQLGLLRERQGRADEAVRHLEAALRLRPDFAEARTALARQRAR